jgi:hypothetical protein
MKIVFMDMEPQRSALGPYDRALYDAAVALIRADDNIVKAALPIRKIHKRFERQNLDNAPCLEIFMGSVVELVRSAQEQTPPPFRCLRDLN